MANGTPCPAFDRDGVARIYTDGVFSEEQDISGLGSLDVDGRLFFGADAVSGYGMDGAVAEVRYWNAVLSWLKLRIGIVPN